MTGEAFPKDARQAADVRVFWRPGCSSCARVKEFLTRRGIPFASVDVSLDPAAMELLASRGIRSVPVVMRGEAFSFAQSLDDVARFLELGDNDAQRLPPDFLMERWFEVLAVARALVARTPPDHWDHEPVPDRPLLAIATHVFRVPISFLACVEGGVLDWVPVSMEPPAPGTDAAALRRLSEEAEAGLRRWWTALADKGCAWPVEKYDGIHSAHVFLERQVWHTAHHTRQLGNALEGLGVDVVGVVPDGLYRGLPMPERIW
jgi:glutaredoxin